MLSISVSPSNFVVELTGPVSERESDIFSDLMSQWQESYVKHIKVTAEAMGVSEECAADVLYLRGRSRWTPTLEEHLIKLHKAGHRPNMCDFGHN